MRGLLSLLKQTCLRRWAAERRAGRLLMRALLVGTEALGVNFLETFGCFPVLTFATHALAEDARVEFSVTRFANAIQHAISFRRQLRAQALFEIWRNVTRQAQHVDECRLRARFLRSLQQHRNVCRETRNHGRDADAHRDPRRSESV